MGGPRRRSPLPPLRLAGDSQPPLAEKERAHLPNPSWAPPQCLGGLWVRVVSPWACSTHTHPQPSARPWEQGSELSPLPWPETFPRIQNFRCPKPGVLGKPVTLVGSQTPPFSPRTNSTAWNLGQLLPISTFSVCPPRSMSVYLGLWLSFSPPLPNFCFSSQAS